jgi:uncharacterized RDD family membrane protein YckC
MNNDNPTTEHQPDVLGDVTIPFEYATTGQRFLNYLIDNIVMRYGLTYLTGALVGVIFALFGPDYILKLQLALSTGNLFNTPMFLFLYLLLIINYTLYYTLCERLFNGYTLGKLITGTKAVRDNMQPLTWRDAILRSLSRMVPLEPLSGFGTPWHDSWTNTMVIKAR